MSQLTARDLMTPDVVTVPPETPVIAVARLLAERGISAVPVLDKAGDGARRGDRGRPDPPPGGGGGPAAGLAANRCSPTRASRRNAMPAPMAAPRPRS